MKMKMSTMALAAIAVFVPHAAATTVFRSINDNGIFTPFNSNTPAGTKFGDGGWLSGFQPDNYVLTGITLGLCTFGGQNPGTTDLVFTFNDGDPSGLVFGTGASLYSTTVRGVALPADDTSDLQLFTVTIPLPNVQTAGGFNNIGFSIGVENFVFDGAFGFQCSSALGQAVGFYTNNASQYSGGAWSLFSFGPGDFGVANFVATITAVPSPSALAVFYLTLVSRRRR